MIGGVDLGGTKIEARLFDRSGESLTAQRIATPDDFPALIAALSGQIAWLTAQSGDPEMPVGLCLPGVIDPQTGRCFAANLPLRDQRLDAALRAHLGRGALLMNDAAAFALSEARGGAGAGARSVLGLILGTGLSAGVAIDAAIPPRHRGLAVEIGHIGLPARALLRHDLPLWPCGCGKSGCNEVYLSGGGLRRLSRHLLGREMRAEMLAQDAAAAGTVLAVWADLAGDALSALQCLLDPELIVLGGGVSLIPGLAARLEEALARHALGDVRPPRLRLARFGDASGARGAALAARDAAVKGAPECAPS